MKKALFLLFVVLLPACDLINQPQNSENSANSSTNPDPSTLNFQGANDGVLAHDAEYENLIAAHIDEMAAARQEIVQLIGVMSNDGTETVLEADIDQDDIAEFYNRMPALFAARNRLAYATLRTFNATNDISAATQNSDGSVTVQQGLDASFGAGLFAGAISLLSGLAGATGKVEGYTRDRIRTASDSEIAAINQGLGLPPSTSREEALDHYDSQLVPAERFAAASRIEGAIGDALDASNGDLTIRPWDPKKEIAEAAVELGRVAVTTVASSTAAAAGSQLPETGFTGELGAFGRVLDNYNQAVPFVDVALNATSVATGQPLQPTDLVAESLYSNTVIHGQTVDGVIPGHFEEGVYDLAPEDIDLDQLQDILERAAEDPDYYRVELLDHASSRLAELIGESYEDIIVTIGPDGTATLTVPQTHSRRVDLDGFPLTVSEMEGLIDMLFVLPGQGITDFVSVDTTGGASVEIVSGDPNSSPASNSTAGSADTDGDGIIDRDDNCVDTPNWYQVDSDGDGIGNECDDTACPDFEVDADGCTDGFDWDRQVAACTQPMCPTGAMYNSVKDCCCDCWDDQTLASVLDPCRPGFLLFCGERDPNE